MSAATISASTAALISAAVGAAGVGAGIFGTVENADQQAANRAAQQAQLTQEQQAQANQANLSKQEAVLGASGQAQEQTGGQPDVSRKVLTIERNNQDHGLHRPGALARCGNFDFSRLIAQKCASQFFIFRTSIATLMTRSTISGFSTRLRTIFVSLTNKRRRYYCQASALSAAILYSA